MAEDKEKKGVPAKESYPSSQKEIKVIRDYVEPEPVIDEFFLRDKTIQSEKRSMRKSLSMDVSTKAKKDKMDRYAYLKAKFYKAGIDAEPDSFIRVMLYITLALLAPTLVVLGIYLVGIGYSVLTIIALSILWWIVGFALFFIIVIVAATIFLNYRAFKRRLEVEKVLPEYLRLVATNYRSGLPLHKALTASNRPRFGIFSKEIEMVSKVTRVKGNFAKALEIFGKKFDSKVLERAMNSISVSVRSGSSVSQLLEDIADNITKMRSMRLRLAASVKNYIIFIVVAGVIVAPLMFAMSFHLNMTISDVKDSLDEQRGPGTAQHTAFAVVQGDGGVEPSNFNIFAILMIITNSVVSGLVIGMIKFGNFHQGMKNIPVFFIVSITLYHLGKILLAGVLVIV